MRGAGRLVPAALAGVLVGAVTTLALQSFGTATRDQASGSRGDESVTLDVAPTMFLAWVPRGLPTGFGADLAAIGDLRATTIVAEDIVWLRASWNASGERVDDPPDGMAIPLDVAAIDPASFATFVPAADRPAIGSVADGSAILSATSAGLRGLGPGSTLAFADGPRVRVSAVLPDEVVGAAEVVVSREVGRRIGVRHERYALVLPADPEAGRAGVKALVRPLLPASLGINRRVQIRAPGDTPYLRAGDAVLPPAAVKARFGEFAARPAPGAPGELRIDPAWSNANIVEKALPAIGTVRCHRDVIPQLAAAMRELTKRGLGHLVRSYHGCFVPRFIGRDPANLLSYHSWGIAFDINLVGNVRGQPPTQDPRLVRILERKGFAWGGSWLVPDGSHFEFHRAA
jgi:hypothetical protein